MASNFKTSDDGHVYYVIGADPSVLKHLLYFKNGSYYLDASKYNLCLNGVNVTINGVNITKALDNVAEDVVTKEYLAENVPTEYLDKLKKNILVSEPFDSNGVGTVWIQGNFKVANLRAKTKLKANANLASVVAKLNSFMTEFGVNGLPEGDTYDNETYLEDIDLISTEEWSEEDIVRKLNDIVAKLNQISTVVNSITGAQRS